MKCLTVNRCFKGISCNFVLLCKITNSTNSPCLSSYRNYLSKSVILSESEDVFTNLALEDWFHKKLEFSKQHILLIWKNRNCIVIGRHQNPWLEVDFNSTGVDGGGGTNEMLTVARRNSGGGTVYHDSENLNLTFFTPRKLYDRRHNLELLKRVLHKEWRINCEINSRDDIMHDNRKVSGSAAKLSGSNAYHHCTLLVDSNKKRMSRSLHEHTKNFTTSATRSTPVPIVNLKELNNTVTLDRLTTAVGLEYLRSSVHTSKSNDSNCGLPVKGNGFQFLYPDERTFPGLTEKVEELKSWEWIFGRTPKFKAKTSVQITELLSNVNSKDSIDIDVEVESGYVKEIFVSIPSPLVAFTTNEMLNNITSSFHNSKYSEEILPKIKDQVAVFFAEKFTDQRLTCTLYT